jgi:ERCC4-related helicase
MNLAQKFQPGSLVKARGREWVVLTDSKEDVLKLRPLGGSDEDTTVIYLPLEPCPPESATFALPDPSKPGSQITGLLLRDSLRLKLRAGAGPFRSFGNIRVEPRAYQLVPLLMALKQETVRLLVADDVGIGKTIEAGLIAREFLDRGVIERLSVICPPHLCEQWKQELASKFNIQAEVVRTGTTARLERGLPAGRSIFEEHPFTVVSLDFIKSDRRRDEFQRACPEFVIVDEAHSCVQSGGKNRHQRYQLLKGLADNVDRHLVFLTATPHSGNEEAFYNLLGLINPSFKELQGIPEGQRRELRDQLASHFVQRRRPDIKEWHDSTVFPNRETAEKTYTLTGNWGELFDEILDYARGMVKRAEGKSQLQQRMNWWAALALLRCISSSPAAASLALRTRLRSAEDIPEGEQIGDIERQAAETVLDGESDDLLTLDENVPAGTTEEVEALKNLIDKAENLKGPDNDPKLAELTKQIKLLIKDGFRPVVFCRYIATAHYVAEQLKNAFKKKNIEIVAVTGEFTPEEREEKIKAFSEISEEKIPLLVATDCLSEGINLQHTFNAVIHYDLTWNPTRHEQREGRVDRFHQPDSIVRVLMFYGKNNPVDGAVLKVILRKAERIRKELGVSIPMPSNSNAIMEAIMEAVLLKSNRSSQIEMDFGEVETNLETAWTSAKEKAKQSQTIFAQRRLKPDDVLPEWKKTISVLGGPEDVQRFIRSAAERLQAPLEKVKNYFKFPVNHLPKPLKERLESSGINKPINITFNQQSPPFGVEYLHRAHPLVMVLAEFLAEQALEEEKPELAARCGAIFTQEVSTRTTIYLLRLRSQITLEIKKESHFVPQKILLSEECLGVAVKGTSSPEILKETDALKLMNLEPSRNMPSEQQTRFIESSIAALKNLQTSFEEIAQKRADELLADHRRVRIASEAKGRYVVSPCLPVDVIGVYVMVPVATI